MNEDWTRQEALKAAQSRLAEAERLVEDAAEILTSNGYVAYAMDAIEALVYIHGALGQ